jgi:hypothetical protein
MHNSGKDRSRSIARLREANGTKYSDLYRYCRAENRMTHVAVWDWACFIAVLVSGLPLCLKTVEPTIEHMDDGSDFDCCPRLHGNTSGSFQCPGIAGQRFPSALRTITHNKLRNMVLTVRNSARKLGRGQNGLCIELTQTKTGEKSPMSRI